MQDAQIAALKGFIETCKTKPELLQDPKLSFFKNFIEKDCKGTLPAAQKTTAKSPSSASAAAEADTSAKSPEGKSDTKRKDPFANISDDTASEGEQEPTLRDADDTDIWPAVEGDGSRFKYPSPPESVSEADQEAAQALKAEATELAEAGNTEAAIEKLTAAIEKDPTMPMMYAARAALSLKLKRPRDVIADCNKALELNPNSARALKLRGRAHRHLGEWEAAANSLREGQKLDYDESLHDVEKTVNEKMAALGAFRRRREEKTQRRRQRALRRQRAREIEEERAEAAARSAEERASGRGFPGGFPGAGGGFPGAGGGFPGAGGGFPGAGAGGMPGMEGFDLSSLAPMLGVDPADMADPEVKQAVSMLMSNPAAAMALGEKNPKVKRALSKMTAAMQSMMGGMGGMGGLGGMGGGGMPDLASMFGGAGAGGHGGGDDVD